MQWECSIAASYTANLAAFLTVSRLDTPIESLDDLSQQYKIQYATLKGSSAYDYFSRMAAIEQRFYEWVFPQTPSDPSPRNVTGANFESHLSIKFPQFYWIRPENRIAQSIARTCFRERNFELCIFRRGQLFIFADGILFLFLETKSNASRCFWLFFYLWRQGRFSRFLARLILYSQFLLFLESSTL